MPATRKCQSTDMVLVHKVFRRELGLLPAMMRAVEPGDSAGRLPSPHTAAS